MDLPREPSWRLVVPASAFAASVPSVDVATVLYKVACVFLTVPSARLASIPVATKTSKRLDYAALTDPHADDVITPAVPRLLSKEAVASPMAPRRSFVVWTIVPSKPFSLECARNITIKHKPAANPSARLRRFASLWKAINRITPVAYPFSKRFLRMLFLPCSIRKARKKKRSEWFGDDRGYNMTSPHFPLLPTLLCAGCFLSPATSCCNRVACNMCL